MLLHSSLGLRAVIRATQCCLTVLPYCVLSYSFTVYILWANIWWWWWWWWTACDNELVNLVARYAVWYGRMAASPHGCSVFQCCSKYDFEYEDCHWATNRLYSRIVSERGYWWIRCKGADVVGAVIYKYQLLLDNFSVSDVKVLIVHVLHFFAFYFFVMHFFFCVPCVRFS